MQLMVRNLRPESHPIKRVAMPSISYVVARSFPGNVIGCDNKLPWHLRSDLRRFREITSDHVVIMGRKTLESIGRPLPNRTNIVLSREVGVSDSGIYWVNSREDALYIADVLSIMNGKSEFFVIGGENIYKLFLDMLDTIYLTLVFGGDIKGDSYFDMDFDRRKWKILQEEDHPASDHDEFAFRFLKFKRRRATRRAINISEFMTERDKFIDFINSHHSGLEKSRISVSHYGDLLDEYAIKNRI